MFSPADPATRDRQQASVDRVHRLENEVVGHGDLRYRHRRIGVTDCMDLTDDQRRSWRERGWIVLAGALSPDLVRDLQHWVDDVAAWATPGAPGLHHHEQTEHGAAVARRLRTK